VKSKFIAIASTVVALAAALWAFKSCGGQPPIDEKAVFSRARAKLARLMKDPPARENGFHYSVELAQLMTYAVLIGDRDAYLALRLRLVDGALLYAQNDPYVQGFLAWRFKKGHPLEASGTTEALRFAEALFLGGKRFARPVDRRMARVIVAGYQRHASIEHGTWLVRNYFNLGTRTFATNSFLVDYDPDFIARLAADPETPALLRRQFRELVARSVALVKKAVAPSGLVYQVVQPELSTLLPQKSVVFSPNDTVRIINVCTVVERSMRAYPRLAKRLLRFAEARERTLRDLYFGRTGERAGEQWAGLGAWGCLTRLAYRAGRERLARRFRKRFVRNLDDALGWHGDLFTWTEVGLTLALLDRHDQKDRAHKKTGR
jgi:hypothetical protein